MGSAAALVLAWLGILTTPGMFDGQNGSLPGIAAASIIVIVYGLASRWGVPAASRLYPGFAAVAMPLGLVAGAIYGTEIALEYILQPADNTVFGYCEFGSVLAVFLIAGLWAGLQTRRLGPPLLAAAGTAAIGTLIWYIVLLAMFLAFRGSAVQEHVLRAEGDFEDFRRSGTADFNVFIMQDMLGAGFFHLLLSPLVALVLGGAGGILGCATAWLRARG